MVTRDIASNIDVEQAIAPGIYTSDPTSAEIDTKDCLALAFALNVGTWTDGTFTFEVQESDTSGSGFTAVDSDELDGTEPVIDAADEDETGTKVHKIGYQGYKRYVKLVCTVTGGPGTGMELGAVAIKGELKNRPAS